MSEEIKHDKAKEEEIAERKKEEDAYAEAEAWKAEAQTKSVEEQLLYDQLEQLYNFKILLLGAGESGKSTILKQLKNIHNHKIPKSDLNHITMSLHQNIVECMRALLGALGTYEQEIKDERHLETVKIVQNFGEDSMLTQDEAIAIQALWKSEPIKNVYEHRADYWILDSCDYYMEHAARFAEEDFEPNEEDCLRARIRTTGIVVSELKSKYAREEGEPMALTVKVVDVGGQRNERKKWMHCFDDVKCILFLSSLAGYHQVLFEDQKRNRMHEALELFKKIAHDKTFKDTPIFLLLNKKDLFEQMIREAPLTSCFEEYKGDNSYKAAFAHIENEFRKQLPTGKAVEIFDVTGVSRRDVKEVFQQVKARLLEIHRPKMSKERDEILRKLKAFDSRWRKCVCM